MPVYVHVYMWMYICVGMCMCGCIYVYASGCVDVGVCVCVTIVYVHACGFVGVEAYICISIVYMCAGEYVCVSIVCICACGYGLLLRSLATSSRIFFLSYKLRCAWCARQQRHDSPLDAIQISQNRGQLSYENPSNTIKPGKWLGAILRKVSHTRTVPCVPLWLEDWDQKEAVWYPNASLQAWPAYCCGPQASRTATNAVQCKILSLLKVCVCARACIGEEGICNLISWFLSMKFVGEDIISQC